MTFSFILFSAFVSWSAYNLYHPVLTHKQLTPVGFLVGWITGELAIHHIAWQAVVVALFVWAGAVSGFLPAIALLGCIAAWLTMLWFYIGGDRVKPTVEQSLQDGLGEDYLSDINTEFKDRFPQTPDYEKIKDPRHMIDSRIEVIKNQPYGNHGQMLDIYMEQSRVKQRPVLLQIHGGAWTEKMGSKNEQALPLMNHMALRGWICVSIDYRLCPTATFPDPIIDCKQALAWVKANIEDFGGDPDFIVLTGGSAGGHLCSLLALTPNDPFFQPGFEDEDTTVQGAVSFYGVYDFTDSEGFQPSDMLKDTLETSIMKLSMQSHLEDYQQVSPHFRCNEDAPPFMIIHGTKDSLVPLKSARSFSNKLREVSKQPVVYAEIRDAQHAFDMFPSIRSEHVKHGVERYLSWLHSRYLNQ